MVIALALAIEAAGPTADIAAINGQVKAVTRHGGEKISSFAQGRDLIRAGKAVDYDGASSNLEFGAHGETVPDFGVSEIQNGKLVLKETVPGTR